jgi:exopolyphosphatase/pppGpp-phosphohydrolase
MDTTFSSVDIGRHTARLLIAQIQGPERPVNVLARKRTYTRLAEGFDETGPRILHERGVKRTRLEERLATWALDRGRGDVMIAGTLVVLSILHFFCMKEVIVSMSDLLEGILLDAIEGGRHGSE